MYLVTTVHQRLPEGNGPDHEVPPTDHACARLDIYAEVNTGIHEHIPLSKHKNLSRS